MAQLTDNIQLVIGNSLNLSTEHKFRMIYFDPPFNSDRDYKLNHNSDVGFSDKWTDADYEKFISKNIDKLYDLLEKDGTLFFHISSTCMYIPEKILRAKFKFVDADGIGTILKLIQHTDRAVLLHVLKMISVLAPHPKAKTELNAPVVISRLEIMESDSNDKLIAKCARIAKELILRMP